MTNFNMVSSMRLAMRRLLSVFLLIVLTVGLSAVSSGCVGGSSSGEDWLKLVPAGSVGVLYVDSDFLHDSTTEQVMKALGVYEDYTNMLNDVENELNVSTSDVKWGMFVLYDYSASDYSSSGSFAMYFEGKFDVNTITKKFLNETPDAKETTYEGVKLYTWKDYDGQYYGAVIAEDHIIVGSLDVVKKIIDRKKGEGKWAEDFKDPLDKVGKGYVLGVLNLNASPSLKASLKQEMSSERDIAPLASKVSSMGYVAMSYKTDGDSVLLTLLITTSDKDTAKEFAKSLDGLRAMAAMSDVARNSTALESFLKEDITIKSDGNDVFVNLKTTVGRIRAIMEYLNSTG